jgi:hypothetical protein
MEIRYRGRMGCKILLERTPKPITAVTVINSLLTILFIGIFYPG